VHSNFVHLTVHTAYSLAEGAIQIRELLAKCEEYCMPAVAVTDTGNLFGALEFSVSASDAGVQPIIGVKLNVRRKSVEDPAHGIRSGSNASPSVTMDTLVLIAKDEAGYRNLLDLVSASFLEGDGLGDPTTNYTELSGKTEGLIVLTASTSGLVGRLILENKLQEAESALLELNELFPDHLYVELQRHGLQQEEKIEATLIDLAYKHGLPLVATNDCYFGSPDMYEAHDVLLCIAESTTVSASERRRVTINHSFKSPAEMQELFADIPEAIENTITIARRCSFMPTTLAPILPKFISDDGRDEDAELGVKSRAGLKKRFEEEVFKSLSTGEVLAEKKAVYEGRLETELAIINQMGYPGYFLIVADFIQWAKSTGIPVGPGRGSGAGSLVAWSLLITDLDPIRWGLLFERFLNPERISMPDFDIDFCQERRGEVIDYVQKKYGLDKVAQIITFGKLQARAVLRDVGRVLEMPYGQIDQICKMVPNNPANPVTLGEAIAGDPEIRKLRDGDVSVGSLIEIGLKLEGLYRNASTHAAGVVIGDRALKQLVPLYKDPRSDMPATQFNMKWVEMAGLVKFDFLGLKTLSVLNKAVELLSKRDICINLDSLPLDDPNTYEMISRGDSIGVFQLESSGMRDVLRKMCPDRFEDIIALVALYRPGPMANIPNYIARKHGVEAVDYMHPKLEPVLSETYGIMIYQEQVQQAAQQLAGYTLGSADILRRAMGKKIKSEMDAQREVFVSGAKQGGVSGEKASSIFDTIAAFAGYGFNKSHAAAYALIAYQTAFLKANYPVEFIAASMTYEMGNTDKLNVFKQELQNLDISLLPPDINKSGREFRVELESDGTLAIRYALSAIKNVGGPGMIAMELERKKGGQFASLLDFVARCDGKIINKRSLESLICSGAFDVLYANRAALMDGVDVIIRHSNAIAEEKGSNQESLFGSDETVGSAQIQLPDREDWPVLDRLRNEFDSIGFYLSAHPLDAYGDSLTKLGVIQSSALEIATSDKNGLGRIDVAGIVLSCKIRTNQRGNRYAFLQMSDQAGVFEITVFSEVLAQSVDLLQPGEPILVRCDSKFENGIARLVASRIRTLDDAIKDVAKGLKIYLNTPDPVGGLAKILSDQQNGRGRVKLVVQNSQQEIDLALPQLYSIDARLRSAVKSLPGIIDVQDM